MSTPQTCQVYIQSNVRNDTIITLWHKNADYGMESITGHVSALGTLGPMTVKFNTGGGSLTVEDYWAVKQVVLGPASSGVVPGVYHSEGEDCWVACQLQSKDANQTLTFSVDNSQFSIGMPSNGSLPRTYPMAETSPLGAVDNVFVLMLENHSFDNILGMISADGGANGYSNSYKDKTYPCASPAPLAMPTDPGHEFSDTYEQLFGEGAVHTPWASYSNSGSNTITNGGFVANYATTTTEITDNNPRLPTPAEYGAVMRCFDTTTQLPVTTAMLRYFASCKRWFSSLPGPTWPNRFFVHGASSGGWTDSPGPEQIGEWVATPHFGFAYPSGASIFDRLDDAKLAWRIYAGEGGSTLGGVPQVASLKGLSLLDVHDVAHMTAAVHAPYPYPYTFIEPNYGDVSGGSYRGGSSQHPMDSMARGEALINAVYEAIRNSPLWMRSLLIVTYDEHGGFYDHVPPPAAPPPNDGADEDLSINSGGFLFDSYGVRVPAFLVSPTVQPTLVSDDLYDHASIPATLEALWGMPPMTDRDRLANTLLSTLTNATLPRNNCPTSLRPQPAEGHVEISPAPEAPPPMSPEVAAQPLPERGNIHGFLHIMAKTDLELANADPVAEAAIRTRFAAIRTRGEAEAYAVEVMAKVRAARAERDAAKAAARAAAPASKPPETP